MADAQAVAETVPVAEAHRFDEQRFATYLHAQTGHSLTGVRQMSGGQSNPTYLIATDHGEYVLRKQPAGNLLPSAHAIDREYRVLAALSSTDVPVPKAVAYCEDASVIGTPFYLMERLRGRIFTLPLLPDCAAADRRGIYLSMAGALALLHGAKWQEIGLSDFGRPSHFYQRQIARWTGQWQKSQSRANRSIDLLTEWLPANLPEETGVTLIHGDFRLNNIMFDPVAPKVVGILDWELATLGPAVADLAHSCISYYLPAALPTSLVGRDLPGLGIPSEAEYIGHYEKLTGKPSNLGPFHRAFALFRLAVIAEGILARANAGTASSANARDVGSRGIQIADQGWQIVND